MSVSHNVIAGYSLIEPGEEWEEIVAAFRALGGVADNIRLGFGQNGRGLFPIDPGQPFHLRVPENLMCPIEDISFYGDRIGVRERSTIRTPECAFFERYANAVSWGGGGRQEMAALISAFDALPNEVRALLASDFGMAPWLEGDATARMQAQYLQSRAVSIRGRDVLIPLFELTNHNARGSEWSAEGGLEVTGEASGEICVTYGLLHDPFSMFHRYAIASREPIAFSMPMKVQVGAIPVSIARTFELEKRGERVTPQVIYTNEGLALSFLMLGQSIVPRLPRKMFVELMKPLSVANVDEEFDAVVHANATKFLKLLAALDPHRGELIIVMRKMALYQLEAMTFCVGAREV
ncbi:MAG TPA: hypothetical protein VMF67_15730 [Rhizomicrobium sp.]|nr:hypothetical protein [Rhizomicrobium sp.]